MGKNVDDEVSAVSHERAADGQDQCEWLGVGLRVPSDGRWKESCEATENNLASILFAESNRLFVIYKHG